MKPHFYVLLHRNNHSDFWYDAVRDEVLHYYDKTLLATIDLSVMDNGPQKWLEFNKIIIGEV